MRVKPVSSLIAHFLSRIPALPLSAGKGVGGVRLALLRLELWRNVTQRKGEHGGLFIRKLSAIRTLRLCRSLCLRHLHNFVCFHLRVLPLSVWLLYVVGLLYHTKFRKKPLLIAQIIKFKTQSSKFKDNCSYLLWFGRSDFLEVPLSHIPYLLWN